MGDIYPFQPRAALRLHGVIHVQDLRSKSDPLTLRFASPRAALRLHGVIRVQDLRSKMSYELFFPQILTLTVNFIRVFVAKFVFLRQVCLSIRKQTLYIRSLAIIYDCDFRIIKSKRYRWTQVSRVRTVTGQKDMADAPIATIAHSVRTTVMTTKALPDNFAKGFSSFPTNIRQ